MAAFKKNWPFLLGLILTVSLLWPLVWAPYFTHHDDMQIIRLYEMGKCLADKQIPCRWVPDLGNLYGYPLFNYYAPLPYYFGAIIYFLTQSLLFSFKLMFAVPFLVSYIFMYLLGDRFWGKKGGSLAAIFYSFAPYKALDFYVRGAMGEMWALMFFPAIFWAVAKLEEKSSIGNLLLLGVFLAGLITSHNLSSMIFLPIVLLWMILLFFKKKNKKFIWFSLGSIILALFLSAFYLLPVTFEKDLVHLETTVEGYFSYTEHFKGFRKLLIERFWGYGSSVREVPGGEKDGLSYQIGWVHLLGLIFAIVASRVLWKKNRWLCSIIIFSVLVTFVSVFMINPRSITVWQSIDPLKYLQFPWRFLLLIIFFISFISGSIFTLNFQKKNLLWLIMIAAVVILNFTYFRPEKFTNITDDELLSGTNWDKQIKRSIYDYLPIFAKEPPAELAKARYEILTGDSNVFDLKEGTDWFTFKTNTNSHTIIRLSQYYFPNWVIYIDDKPAKIEYTNNSLGLMTIILGKGDHIVRAKLYDTPIRSIANTMSVVGFGLSLFLFLISQTQVRKWIAYYKKRLI